MLAGVLDILQLDYAFVESPRVSWKSLFHHRLEECGVTGDKPAIHSPAFSGSRLNTLQELLKYSQSDTFEPEAHLVLGRAVSDASATDFLLEGQARFIVSSDQPSSTDAIGGYRAIYSRNEALAVSDGRVRNLSGRIGTASNGVKVVANHQALYQDIWPPKLRAATVQEHPQFLVAQFERVCDFAKRVDPLLGRLMNKLLCQIVFVADLNYANRNSFSFRTDLPGVLFVEENRSDSIVFEAVLHEFIHQLVWLIWQFQPMPWLHTAKQKIKSPMTGRFRDADVMFHAFLIYALTARYLQSLEAGRQLDGETFPDRRRRTGKAAHAIFLLLAKREAVVFGKADMMDRLACHLGICRGV